MEVESHSGPKFLPFESIYAEVIRRSGLVDQLRDEFKITVAGPNTGIDYKQKLKMEGKTLVVLGIY